ncbi:hypothetical protein BM221_000014 [Beauveria bassiana]|uniref:Uncharacterized protein n=1 Tax=Beauveria bassiana TaxID=176275 RepID=A0A2N6NZC4_BEABA|nr:hypothetical protein BM221_000014 [Beauveria bassiana]
MYVDTAAIHAADAEARVQHRRLVAVGSNGTGTRGVVAPGRVLCVLLNVGLARHVLAGEHLADFDGLAAQGVARDADGLVHGLQVPGVVAAARVKVVVRDVGHVERVGGAQAHGAGIVARVRLEDGPGEDVVVLGDVDAVLREVAAKVDGPAKEKVVVLAILRDGALVEHGHGEAVGRERAAVAKPRILPLVQTGIALAVEAKRAALERRKVLGHLALHVDLVVVLQVAAHAGQVDDDGDIERLELLAGTNAAELQNLRRVVGSARDNDFARGIDLARLSLASGAVARAGLVQIVRVGCIPRLCIGVGVPEKQASQVADGREELARGKGAAGVQAQQLRVLEGQRDLCRLCAEPAVVAVAAFKGQAVYLRMLSALQEGSPVSWAIESKSERCGYIVTSALCAVHPPKVWVRGYSVPFILEPAGGCSPVYRPPSGVS